MRKAAQYQNDSQIYTQLMKYDDSHRPSPQQPEDQKISRFRLILSTICPCFIGNSSNDQYSNHEETKSNLNAQKQIKGNSIADVRKQQQITVQTLVNEAARKKAKESLTSYEVGNNNENRDSNMAASSQKWSIYPVSQIKEDKLIVTGSAKKYLLCKIKRVEVEAGRSQRSYIKKPIAPLKITSNTSKNVDKYWYQRYSLFSKFDEGVSINEQSWAVMIPEAVSEYIAGKIKYEAVANLYAGVGGDAIKLANTCNKVIAWDESEINMKSMYINSKIYGSENIEIAVNLSAVLKKQLQFILVSSLMKIQQSLSSASSDVPAQISNILTKFLPICSNFALILPANTNITALTEIIANQIKNLNIKTETCCLKVQKIFYAQQLKYLAVFFAANIEDSVAINDQLNWIYKKLHLDTGKSNDEKRLIKKLREMYGMVQLLNFVLQSGQLSKGSPVQKFIQYIKKNSLLPDQKMVKYIKDNEMQNQSNNFDYDQQESGNFDEPEKTVSSISIPSIIHRVSTDNNQVENENDPYKSAAFNNRETLKSIQTKSLIKEGPIGKKQSVEKHGKIVKRKSVEGGKGEEEDRSSMVELYPIQMS